MKKAWLLYAPLMIVALIGVVWTPSSSNVSAEKEDENGPYEIYPKPHHVDYHDGKLSLKKQADVIYDDTIDDVTKEKVKKIFKQHHLPAPKQVKEPSDDHVTIYVGTKDSDGPADHFAEKTMDISKKTFAEIDAYQLGIQDKSIAVIGKDTDSAFYGLESLDEILKQSDDGKVRQLDMQDYANTKIRGFIEGYYGIPWSNENRKSLMKFGGKHKMTSYIFAPKDDPYHREKWDKLYPEQDLKEISDMAKVGRENKTQFAWTISPLGEAAQVAQQQGQDAAMDMLDDGKQKVLAKFDQLYDAGVRQFGVLGDDVGALPLDYVVGLMDAVSKWADDKGDVKDIIYTPAAYNSAWAWDGGKELNKLEKHFADNIQIMWTGENTVAPVEQYTIDRFKNRDNNGVVRRDPVFWMNWPVNDVDMTRVFLGKGDMYHKGVKDLAGVVTNPMQEAQASKVALFATADYAWNTEKFDADKSWKDSMKYVEPDATEPFQTLAKHMAHADPQDGMSADESEAIKDLLKQTIEQLDNKEVTDEDASKLIDELQAIADAGDTFMDKSQNAGLKEELKPFIKALQDMVRADVEYLRAEQAIEKDDTRAANQHYAKGQVLRQNSLNHERPMLDGEDKVNAKPAAKRLQPFSDQLEDKVSNHMKGELNADALKTLVNQYADSGQIKQGQASRQLKTHVSAITHFADANKIDKAKKHTKGLQKLVKHFREDKQIDKQSEKKITHYADQLIEKWD